MSTSSSLVPAQDVVFVKKEISFDKFSFYQYKFGGIFSFLSPLSGSLALR